MSTVRDQALAVPVLIAIASVAAGDDVLLKNKLLYRGALDKDNTLRQVSDGIRRVVFRDAKIERITPSDPYRNLERFQIVQPLVVHGGVMPPFAINVQSTAWSDKGRRTFRYEQAGTKGLARVEMTQAINDLGPHMIKYRGVDGFWLGQVATGQVPKPIVTGLLGRVDRTNLNERQRVARFYLQADWYDDARVEVESIAKDFPAERERCTELLRAIRDLDARRKLLEISLARRSRRPADLLARLRSFPTEDVAPDVLTDVRDQLRKEEADLANDRRLGESLRDLEKSLTPDLAKAWKGPIAEALLDLEKAPDALRPRLAALAKADPGATTEAKLALAMSGWIVGAEAAVPSLDDASALWKARGDVRDYLRVPDSDEKGRSEALVALQTIEFSKDAARPDGRLDLETLTRIVERMAPPQHEDRPEGKPTIHRVANDSNDVPTEYQVLLPPEYHPLRSYPTVVALHDERPVPDDRKPTDLAIDWWKQEATRRGYIVVAPEYKIKGQSREYKYSPTEHASVELSLRDARKRYAIDSDRVYLGGSLQGGNMALDFGLAHPDLFAGVASVNGLPAKYVYAYRKHVENVPLYFALGELAPAAKEVIFDATIKPMIVDTYDVTYVEYYRRGLEDLPEEAGPIMDWMEKQVRDPAPKSFEASSARPSDARFFGLVIGELAAGRAIAPEAADPLGKNIKPAKVTMKTSALSNLLNITTAGVTRLDVWVSPRLIDFKRRIEVRINGRSYYKAIPKPNLAPMLTDLRVRGDRQQLYWLKVSTAR